MREKMKPIYMIVAHDENYGIGFQNTLPWNLPDDLKHFQKITCTVNNQQKQNMILMGTNTWISLPRKPLPKRKNVILSNSLTVDNTKNLDVMVCNN